MGPGKRSYLETNIANKKSSAEGPKVEDASDGLGASHGQDVVDVSSDARPTSSDFSQRNESGSMSASPGLKPHSWYSGGSWPRSQKSTPSTKVDHETILANKSTHTRSSSISKFDTKKPLQVIPFSNIKSSPSKTAEIGKDAASLSLPKSSATEQASIDGKGLVGLSIPLETDSNKDNAANDLDEQRIFPSASGWRGWLSSRRSESVADSGLDSAADPGYVRPASPPFHREVVDEVSRTQGEIVQPTVSQGSAGSWLAFWPTAAHKSAGENAEDLSTSIKPRPESEQRTDTQLSTDSIGTARGSTWAFWYKETGRPGKPGLVNETGVLAVNEVLPRNEIVRFNASAAADLDSDKRQQKRDGSSSLGIGAAHDNGSQKPPSSKADVSVLQENKDSKVAKSESSKDSVQSTLPTHSKLLPANLLLPSLQGTYRIVENPSIMQQIAQLLTFRHQPAANHVHLLKERPKIKKALAIGIHGLFPAPVLRTVIGQPTGTSIRFANHAVAAIRRWLEKHGYHEGDTEVEKISLEGEGKIAERVDNLWKLLLNWIDHIRMADFVLVACHSQGVPVAVMLVAKLIEFGVVTSARIGICAMAGVSLGPFADYKSRLFSGAAAELFDFASYESEVSRRYQDSLKIALKYGVRITYVGSIDDQLVSLESAIFGPLQHPYIHRSVFVDGRIHAPDFLTHLVGFALKLRNLGVSDHGLIRELSVPLAGSLYTGEGHSRLYDEPMIYDVATSFALETSSVGDVPLHLEKIPIQATSNPFQLPWSMRGLLEEDIVKTELVQETKKLLQQFDEWRPTTRALKDVKYRLEAIKSKL